MKTVFRLVFLIAAMIATCRMAYAVDWIIWYRRGVDMKEWMKKTGGKQATLASNELQQQRIDPNFEGNVTVLGLPCSVSKEYRLEVGRKNLVRDFSCTINDVRFDTQVGAGSSDGFRFAFKGDEFQINLQGLTTGINAPDSPKQSK